MTRFASAVAIACLWAAGGGLGGCANGLSPLPSLTTGSLSGKADGAAKVAAAKPDPMAPLPDTPTNRALQVGMTTARAAKCGFNFDGAGVKQKFLASEAQSGVSVEELTKVEKVYGASYNAVTRAVAKKEGYCHDGKVKMIKDDLSQVLAGNYAPQRLHPKEEDDSGLLSVGGTQFVWE